MYVWIYYHQLPSIMYGDLIRESTEALQSMITNQIILFIRKTFINYDIVIREIFK
jgi:hypothetical protein